jgi:hypothetical protein
VNQNGARIGALTSAVNDRLERLGFEGDTLIDAR